jgi:hypothetical protein
MDWIGLDWIDSNACSNTNLDPQKNYRRLNEYSDKDKAAMVAAAEPEGPPLKCRVHLQHQIGFLFF